MTITGTAAPAAPAPISYYVYTVNQRELALWCSWEPCKACGVRENSACKRTCPDLPAHVIR